MAQGPRAGAKLSKLGRSRLYLELSDFAYLEGGRVTRVGPRSALAL
jgi:hypothetical protein